MAASRKVALPAPFTLGEFTAQLPRDESTQILRIAPIESPISHGQLCSLVGTDKVRWCYGNAFAHTDAIVEFPTVDAARKAFRRINTSKLSDTASNREIRAVYVTDAAAAVATTAPGENIQSVTAQGDVIYYRLPQAQGHADRVNEAIRLIAETRPQPRPRYSWIEYR